MKYALKLVKTARIEGADEVDSNSSQLNPKVLFNTRVSPTSSLIHSLISPISIPIPKAPAIKYPVFA